MASSPLLRYTSLLTSRKLLPDPSQLLAVTALNSIYSILPNSPPRGLYLYGGPGRGKTLVAQLLIHPLVRHVHAHTFFRDLHRKVGDFRGNIPAVAAELSHNTRVLALDELEVTDIADALVLSRTLVELKKCGVALVTTSNRTPEALYSGGLNVELVQPNFARVLRGMCDVIALDGSAVDYRKVLDPTSEGLDTTTTTALTPTTTPNLYIPAQRAEIIWNAIQESLYPNSPSAITSRLVAVPLAGRNVKVPQSCGRAARFTFNELCGGNSSAACFSALMEEFDIFFIDQVPNLASTSDDLLRRFVVLIDLLYERRKILILAATYTNDLKWKNIDELFHNVGEVAVSAETPESLRKKVENEGGNGVSASLKVLGEGGSSGRLTTMITPIMEWSATGRIGASLTDFAAGRFAVFSSARASSRIHEMMRFSWIINGGVLKTDSISRLANILLKDNDTKKH
jgi:protein AFG1